MPGTDRVDVDARPRAARRHGRAAGGRLAGAAQGLRRAGRRARAGSIDLPWRLTIAGDGTRSPATLRGLEAEIARLGACRIALRLRGAVTAAELGPLYAASDLFVLPSRFEGYGMAYAEAIAHGLPVVGTTAGAIPETVPSAAGDAGRARRRRGADGGAALR